MPAILAATSGAVRKGAKRFAWVGYALLGLAFALALAGFAAARAVSALQRR
jgi:hypothetical protein